jgi:hypothetical protein
MATSWISFGPDLEPMASETRGAAQRPAPRRDGLSVTGTSEEVVFKLVQAAGANGGWCELEEVVAADRRRMVYVNGAAIRLVVDED